VVEEVLTKESMQRLLQRSIDEKAYSSFLEGHYRAFQDGDRFTVPEIVSQILHSDPSSGETQVKLQITS
jgi:hypothetical protein